MSARPIAAVRAPRPPIVRRRVAPLTLGFAVAFERLAMLYVFVELWLTVLGGAYKWVLVLLHVPFLNTLRDIAAFAIFAFAFVSWAFAGLRVSSRGLLLGCMIVLALLNGIMQNGLVPAFVGFKVLLPIQVGYIASARIGQPGAIRKLGKQLGVAWAITIVGVFIDKFTDFPWRGLEYENFGVVNSVSRLWWSGGIERLAGLTGSSAAAATLIVYGTWAVCLKIRHFGWRILVMFLSGYIIWITTTKTLLVLLPIFVGLASLPPADRSRLVGLLAKAVVVVSVAALFWSALRADLATIDYKDAGFSGTLLQRFDATWPKAIYGVDGYKMIFGVGIGGVGLPNLLFGDTQLGPLDNLLLWTTLSFGGVGAILAFGQLFQRLHLAEEHILLEGLGAILLAYGLTEALVDTRLSAALLGVYLGLMVRRVSDKEPLHA